MNKQLNKEVIKKLKKELKDLKKDLKKVLKRKDTLNTKITNIEVRLALDTTTKKKPSKEENANITSMWEFGGYI